MATLSPYINFNGRAREALEFWAAALGGIPDIMTFADMPADPRMPLPAGTECLVMHGQLVTPGGLTIMAADGGVIGEYEAPNSGMSVALTGVGPEDLAYIRAAHTKILEGGTANMPFELAPWGDYYGDGVDKFGVHWTFDVHPTQG
jgi:PhnB protein